MLRIIQLAGSASAKNYYKVSDYFLGDGQELPGYWHGKGAKLLGLDGELANADAFNALCDNTHPQTGQRLSVLNNDNRRVGWDFNWHAPKSVTLAYELSGDARVLDAFRDAVDYAMGQVEADMKTRVRAGGLNEDRVVGNAVYAGGFVSRANLVKHLHAYHRRALDLFGEYGESVLEHSSSNARSGFELLGQGGASSQ